jgi:hypothetical protein
MPPPLSRSVLNNLRAPQGCGSKETYNRCSVECNNRYTATTRTDLERNVKNRFPALYGEQFLEFGNDVKTSIFSLSLSFPGLVTEPRDRVYNTPLHWVNPGTSIESQIDYLDDVLCYILLLPQSMKLVKNSHTEVGV